MAHEELIKEGESALRKNPNLKPEDVQDYYRKKGMDKKEAKEAIDKWESSKIVEDHNKTQKGYSQETNKNSSFWFWFFIVLIIGAVFYLFYSGIIDLQMLNLIIFK